jgi:hypothetical protein
VGVDETTAAGAGRMTTYPMAPLQVSPVQHAGRQPLRCYEDILFEATESLCSDMIHC